MQIFKWKLFNRGLSRWYKLICF